nr:hypothetical protein BgiMline_022513 [Biomphalaria glabrata]
MILPFKTRVFFFHDPHRGGNIQERKWNGKIGKGTTVPRLPQYQDFLSRLPRLPQYLDFHSTKTSTVPRLPQYLDLHSTKTSTVPRLPQYLDFHST